MITKGLSVGENRQMTSIAFEKGVKLGGWAMHELYALELAHAQLLETEPVFQPTCESFSRDAPEINRLSVLPGYRPVHSLMWFLFGVLVVWWGLKREALIRITGAWGLKDAVFW